MIWSIKGYNILIDEDDYDKYKQYYYRVNPREATEGRFYFIRRTYVQGKTCFVSLHRDIMGCVAGDKQYVDHVNGDTLDNRKSNLRVCSNAENIRNSKLSKSNSCGVKGVYWLERAHKWRAQIMANRKKYNLGNYANIEDAKSAYAKASKELHGEFGRTK